MANQPVPLPTGFNISSDFPKAREKLVNCFAVGGQRILSRPGIEDYNTGVGKCRGAETYRRRLFQASGSDIIIINEDKNSPSFNLGEIGGADEVIFAPGNTMMMILSRGGRLFKWEDSGGQGTMTQIDITNVYVDVAYMDGRWFYVPANGGPIEFSEVGDGGDIRPLNFFDAELSPDENIGILNVRNTLYVLGEASIELFRSNVTFNEEGIITTVVQRVSGGQIQGGYIGARLEYDVSFAYVGRNIKGHAGIFVAQTGKQQKISNDAVDEVLNRYSAAEVSLVKSQRYTWNGIDLIVFTFLRDTLAFGGGEWHIITSDLYPVGEQPWQAVYCQYVYGQYYVGDLVTSQIGVLTDINTDYGLNIDREIQTYTRLGPDAQFVIAAAEIDTLMGLTPTVGVVPEETRTEFQIASQWQVATDEEFTDIVFDSGRDVVHTNLITLTEPLVEDTPYWWKVRYEGEASGWTPYTMPTIFTTIDVGVNPPLNIAPANGAVNQVIDTLLVANTFNPIGGAQNHDFSQWQIATDPLFSNIVFDSGDDAVNLTSITVTPDLDNNTTYYWHVRYSGDISGYSSYSTPTEYSTVETDGVRTPTNLTPPQNAIDVVLLPTFTASSFSFIGPDQIHINSQWQIATDQAFNNIVFDSGDDPVNLESITLTTELELSTVYYWRVRYQGDQTGYSNYSASTSLTTVAQYFINYVDPSPPAWLHRANSIWNTNGPLSMSIWFMGTDQFAGDHFFFDFRQSGQVTRAYLSQRSNGSLIFSLIDANGVQRKLWNSNAARIIQNGVLYNLMLVTSQDADSTIVYLNDTVWAGTFGDIDISGSWFSAVWTQNSLLISNDQVQTTQLLTSHAGDFWMDTTYQDWSSEVTRRKFIDAAGQPVDLGENGEIPTGFEPRLYAGAEMLAADWNTGIIKGTRQEWDDGSAGWDRFTDAPAPVVFAADLPMNISPANGELDVSLTPTLIATPFSSDDTVTSPGGASDPDYRIGLSVSQNGITFGPEVYKEIGQYGNYSNRMRWSGPGGLGKFESFMGIRIRTNAPLEFATDALYLNVAGI